MFDWFRPRSPLGTAEKTWTEIRMRWLAGRLGLGRILRAKVVLPDSTFFPEQYSGTPDDARSLLDLVCGYMGLCSDRYDLEVRLDESMPDGTVGLYSAAERPAIWLARSLLDDPERLVATLAHELAHDVLLGGKLIDPGETDHEEVTDLVPVCLGLGVFLANSTVRDRSTTLQNYHYFQINRQGYLSSRILGYALALFAFVRGEEKPDWIGSLRLDAAVPCRAGLRYLLKTGDTLFSGATARDQPKPLGIAEAIVRLGSGSATVRMEVLWEVPRLGPASDDLVAGVARCLDDPDIELRAEAARAITHLGPSARTAVSALLYCLKSPDDRLRGWSAAALGAIGERPDDVIPELNESLRDSSPDVLVHVAGAVARFGPEAAVAVPNLVAAMASAQVDCDGDVVDALADALAAIVPVGPAPDAHLRELDPEIRAPLARAIKDARRGRSGRKRDIGSDP